MVQKTAAARQIYQERMDGLLKGAEIENIPDRARRERIKKMLAYSIEGIAREKRGADSDAVFREIKAYIDLVRDLTQGAHKQTAAANKILPNIY